MNRKLIQAIAGLSPGEAAVLARAWWALAVFSVALRCGVSVPRLERFIERRMRSTEATGGTADQLAWAVGAASRHHLLPARCLERSLALRYLLARSGVPSTLRIGARTTDGQLEAHAWIEVEGRAVAESHGVEERFLPLEPVRAGKASG